MTHSVQEKKTRQKGRLNKGQGRIKSPLFQKGQTYENTGGVSPNLYR